MQVVEDLLLGTVGLYDCKMEFVVIEEKREDRK